jgi:lysozyme
MTDIHPLVCDLSHWDSAADYAAVKRAGIVGVIYKATQGSSSTDSTYVQQQHAAKAAGLLWGAYHFADGSDVNAQVNNFMRYACPDPDELFCLDWEDNGGNKMSLADVKTWIAAVEKQLGRDDQCVLYSGNTAKEALGNKPDPFLSSRRLWLCQYSATPSWPKTWDGFWLWQFTDGQSGPSPHSIAGIGPCDISSYPSGDAVQLAAEWASGGPAPAPGPTPDPTQVVNVLISAPAGVTVKVRQTSSPGSAQPQEAKRKLRAAESNG